MESNLSLGFVRYVSWSRTLVESQRCTSMRTVLPNHDTLPVVPLESTAVLLHYFFFFLSPTCFYFYYECYKFGDCYLNT